MVKSPLEGFLIRPQGEPMAYPCTVSAKFSQFPWRFMWNESFFVRHLVLASVFIIAPIYWKVDKVLKGPENTKLWTEKRKHDAEEHHKHMEKLWEVRT